MNRFPAPLALWLVITQSSVPNTAPESTVLVTQAPAAAEQTVKVYRGWSCGSPFYTLAEGRTASDAIVYVRLDSQVTYDHAIATGDFEMMTAHEATVLDVFKTHQAMPAGSSMTIVQRGGIARGEDGIHHHHLWNQFEIMPAETDWVLFLRWNSYWGGFQVVNYEEGAFQIVGNTIATAGRGRFPEKWRGQTASAFLAALAENGGNER